MSQKRVALPPPVLCPMAEARFSVLELSLFAAASRKTEAGRVISTAQRLLGGRAPVGPLVRVWGPVRMFRVDTEVPISVTGAYPALVITFELLRPLSELWEVVIPTPSLCRTLWHLWGTTQHTNVVGLSQIFFQAHSDSSPSNEVRPNPSLQRTRYARR